MESHSVSNNFGVNSSSQSLQPMGSFTNDSADVDEVPLDPAIDGNPSSLLFYEPCQELFQINSKRRYNAYAKIFSSSWDGISVRDGNQGCEPLVFFPPLFPLLEECSKRARIGHQATSSSKVDSNPQEAAKVIENSQRDINIAFVNELSKIFGLIGIDTKEVLEAAGTKWNFLKFSPGLVGGHCIGVDPYYLAQKAQEIGYHPEIILAGRRVNDGMGAYVANEVVKLMIKCNNELTI